VGDDEDDTRRVELVGVGSRWADVDLAAVGGVA